MIGFVIQARTGSTRLPGKMIMPFYREKSILQIIIGKLKNNFFDIPIILATTVNPLDDSIAEIGCKAKVVVYRGSEENVLERFIEAAEENSITKIIRICADNPFLDMLELGKLINVFKTANLDYLSFKTSSGTPVIRTHYGFWAEGVSLKALQKVKCSTTEEFFLEHVTNYIYSNEVKFKIRLLEIPRFIEKNNLRLTVDTKEDFRLTQEIYFEACKYSINGLEELIKLIQNKNSWYLSMEQQIKLNSK